MNSNTDHVNETPVIGILTIPISKWVAGDQRIILKSKNLKSFLPNAYIQWLESAGVQVVPIQYNITKPIMNSILKQVNGVLIIGKIIDEDLRYLKQSDIDTEVIRYARSEFHIFNFAKKQNDKGSFFPLFGVGGGSQDLLWMEAFPNYYKNLTSKKNALNFMMPKNSFIKIDKNNQRYPLRLNNNTGFLSKTNTPTNNLNMWKNNNVCYTEMGIVIKPNGEFIKSIYDKIYINSIGKIPKNGSFINMFTFQRYPFYGTLFHPEAIFHNSILNQTKKSIPMNNLSLFLSNRFARDARKNLNKLIAKSILIYNYTLFSPRNIIKILFPDQWEVYIKQFTEQMPISYFFGLTSDKKLL